MDPQTVFCPNLDCPARGQPGKGNIHVHSRKEHRYLCDVCDKTFTETKGTVFYRLRTDTEQVTLVVSHFDFDVLPAGISHKSFLFSIHQIQHD